MNEFANERNGASLVTRLSGFWRRRDVLIQAVFFLVVVVLIASTVMVTMDNMNRLSVKSGYGFLFEKAAFELGESLIRYSAGDTYLRAFAVGILNTLKVAVLGIILSTFVGLIVALGQLSASVVVVRICRAYIEIIRNVPLLMQLIFWHTFLTRGLPTVRRAISPAEGIYLTNRGLYIPAPIPDPAHAIAGWALIAGILAAAAFLYWRSRSARDIPALRWTAALVLLPPLLVFVASGAPLEIEYPTLTGFNFTGGISISPEFAAMLLGLTLYTGAFNAEIIRAGILGVPHGQTEAGRALGLSNGRIMRLIVLPQSLRIIIPPITNSYLNLTKESSLAVAIGYPELVRVANISLAETSQSIECISIIMGVYLVLSLITALILNWFNRSAALEVR